MKNLLITNDKNERNKLVRFNSRGHYPEFTIAVTEEELIKLTELNRKYYGLRNLFSHKSENSKDCKFVKEIINRPHYQENIPNFCYYS